MSTQAVQDQIESQGEQPQAEQRRFKTLVYVLTQDETGQDKAIVAEVVGRDPQGQGTQVRFADGTIKTLARTEFTCVGVMQPDIAVKTEFTPEEREDAAILFAGLSQDKHFWDWQQWFWQVERAARAHYKNVRGGAMPAAAHPLNQDLLFLWDYARRELTAELPHGGKYTKTAAQDRLFDAFEQFLMELIWTYLGWRRQKWMEAMTLPSKFLFSEAWKEGVTTFIHQFQFPRLILPDSRGGPQTYRLALTVAAEEYFSLRKKLKEKQGARFHGQERKTLKIAEALGEWRASWSNKKIPRAEQQEWLELLERWELKKKEVATIAREAVAWKSGWRPNVTEQKKGSIAPESLKKYLAQHHKRMLAAITDPNLLATLATLDAWQEITKGKLLLRARARG